MNFTLCTTKSVCSFVTLHCRHSTAFCYYPPVALFFPQYFLHLYVNKVKYLGSEQNVCFSPPELTGAQQLSAGCLFSICAVYWCLIQCCQVILECLVLCLFLYDYFWACLPSFARNSLRYGGKGDRGGGDEARWHDMRAPDRWDSWCCDVSRPLRSFTLPE